MKQIEIVKSDGKIIRGELFEPATKATYPIAIFSHGFGGCYKELHHHASEFTDEGIGVLFFDFCGGGMKSTSDGSFAEMTVLTEKDDLLTVFAYVRQMPEVKDEGIYLVGESQGGFVSAIVAAELKDNIASLILWYPAFIIPDDAKRRMQKDNKNEVFGQRISESYNEAAISIDVDEIQRAYTGPVLIIHGDKDNIVPIEYSNRAIQNYKNAKLITIKGAGHGFNGTDSKNAGLETSKFIL